MGGTASYAAHPGTCRGPGVQRACSLAAGGLRAEWPGQPQEALTHAAVQPSCVVAPLVAQARSTAKPSAQLGNIKDLAPSPEAAVLWACLGLLLSDADGSLGSKGGMCLFWAS